MTYIVSYLTMNLVEIMVKVNNSLRIIFYSAFIKKLACYVSKIEKTEFFFFIKNIVTAYSDILYVSLKLVLATKKLKFSETKLWKHARYSKII